MSSHYQTLQIAPTASIAEIEAAFEAQYNQWRRLVTHHDPNVVNQANQTLQALEIARSTLTDPSRRAEYDAKIGVGGAAGGLADPTAFGQAAPPAPFAPVPAPPIVSQPAAAPQPMATPAQPGLWACYKCSTENPTGTKFCFKCGSQLVRECPECKNDTSLVATGMCGICGNSYDNAVERQQVRQEIQKIDLEIAPVQKQYDEVRSGAGNGAIGCGSILAALAIIVMLSNFTGGFVILIVAGIIFYVGMNSNNTSKGTASALQHQLEQLGSRKRRLQSQLSVSSPMTQEAPAIAAPVSVARIIAEGAGYKCSSCGGYVRQDAALCKHCKKQFAM